MFLEPPSRSIFRGMKGGSVTSVVCSVVAAGSPFQHRFGGMWGWKYSRLGVLIFPCHVTAGLPKRSRAPGEVPEGGRLVALPVAGAAFARSGALERREASRSPARPRFHPPCPWGVCSLSCRGG